MCEELPYVVVDLTRLDLVEDEHVRHFGQQREPETLPNTELWTAGDKELDGRDLGDELAKDRKDRGSRFFVLAFVQRVDDDDSRNGGFHERLNDQLLHLVVEGFVDNLRIRLDELDEYRSKRGVPPGELDSESGED